MERGKGKRAGVHKLEWAETAPTGMTASRDPWRDVVHALSGTFCNTEVVKRLMRATASAMVIAYDTGRPVLATPVFIEFRARDDMGCAEISIRIHQEVHVNPPADPAISYRYNYVTNSPIGIKEGTSKRGTLDELYSDIIEGTARRDLIAAALCARANTRCWSRVVTLEPDKNPKGDDVTGILLDSTVASHMHAWMSALGQPLGGMQAEAPGTPLPILSVLQSS